MAQQMIGENSWMDNDSFFFVCLEVEVRLIFKIFFI
jgi:hypothetical protein